MKNFPFSDPANKNSQAYLGLTNIKSFSAIQFINWNELHQKLCTDLNQAKCPHGVQSIFMCFSQNCKNNALICGMKMCKCKETHLNCFHHIQTISFVKNLENQYKKQAKLMKEVEERFDQLIDDVSLLRDQILTRMKYSFFRPKELHLIEWVQRAEYNRITGAYLKGLLNDIYDKNEDKFMRQRTANTMSKVLEITHSIKSSLSKIRDQYVLYKEFKPIPTLYNQAIFSSNTWESKILSTEDELKTLEEFMPENKLKKLNLLYRASQNAFQVNKFFELCEGISPTMILIKTAHDKVIGGFTPIPWIKYKEKTQSSDPSKQTFLFSLTNKEKLLMKNSDYATYYYAQNWGPIFGRIGYPDLSIYNKANESSKGNWIFRAKNFTHQSYIQPYQPEIYKAFTGASTEDFQILDWEVFQVEL